MYSSPDPINLIWYIRNYVLLVHWQSFIHRNQFMYMIDQLAYELAAFSTPFQNQQLPASNGTLATLTPPKIHILINFGSATVRGKFQLNIQDFECLYNLPICGSILMYSEPDNWISGFIDGALAYFQEQNANASIHFYQNCEEALASLALLEPRIAARIAELPLPV